MCSHLFLFRFKCLEGNVSSNKIHSNENTFTMFIWRLYLPPLSPNMVPYLSLFYLLESEKQHSQVHFEFIYSFFSLICNLTSSATVQRMPRTSKPLSEIPIRTAGEAHNVSLWTWCCKNAGATGKHLYPHLFLFLMGQQDVRRVIYVLLHLTVYAGCGKVDLPAFIWKIIQ